MKKLLTAVAVLLFPLCMMAQVNEKPFVVPELKQWEGATGEVTPSGRIIVASKQLRQVAQQLVDDAKALGLKPLAIAKGKAKAGDIVLVLKKLDNAGAEAYRMNVGNTIVLEAPTAQGVFWATRTLLQLSEQSDKLPKGIINDAPTFKMRGFMIDCGRKFIPMSYLRKLVKILAYYKMNTLQVHLNDNGFVQYFGNDWDKTYAAFRLQCDTYPGLTAKDGSYSKQEFIDLQKLGEQLGVEIIPEIDAPAHSLAFVHYRPELGSKEFGMDHLDLDNPESLPFVEALYKEYLSGKNPVFRGPRVHVGTDEYNNQSEKTREQFRLFTDKLFELIQSYGKQPMAWGALNHAPGKTPVRSKGVLMSIWNTNFAHPKETKELGYDILSIPDWNTYIVPMAGYYHDYLDTKQLYNNWTPNRVGKDVFDIDDPTIVGGMFAVWNDHYGNGVTVADIHDRVFDALPTLATKFWTATSTSLPYDNFVAQTAKLSEAPGVNEKGLLKGKTFEAKLLQAGQALGWPITEVGFGNEVSFDVDCKEETKGAVAFSNGTTKFYLSDPRTGKVGFEREDYLNTFNYTLPKTGKVQLRVVSDNKSVSLYVDGKLRETLKVIDAVAPRTPYDYALNAPAKPVIYMAVHNSTMHYLRTLFFPLEKVGNCNSTLSNLVVKAADGAK